MVQFLSSLTKEIIKSIIEQKGGCDYIRCSQCPFSEMNNTFDITCNQMTKDINSYDYNNIEHYELMMKKRLDISLKSIYNREKKLKRILKIN